MTGSVYWLWPLGARRVHAFINGGGISLCRRHNHSDTRPAPRDLAECRGCSSASREDPR